MLVGHEAVGPVDCGCGLVALLLVLLPRGDVVGVRVGQASNNRYNVCTLKFYFLLYKVMMIMMMIIINDKNNNNNYNNDNNNNNDNNDNNKKK